MTEFITTEDGSLTLFNVEAGELYHNSAGAYTESYENYVVPSNGLGKLKETQELTLLDACFGLGYNTFVLLQSAIADGISGEIRVTGVELDPEIITLVPEVLRIERFAELRSVFGVNLPNKFGHFSYQHGKLVISLELIHADLRTTAPKLTERFDLVFHDAFSPRKVPELWTVDLFAEYYRLLELSQGVILTYSSAGAVRGGLVEARFNVYKTTGVGRKSGGTLAAIAPLPLDRPGVYKLSAEEQMKLSGRSGVPYRDSGFLAPREAIVERRAAEQSNQTLVISD